MRPNRERGDQGTENASSCSGPNGEASELRWSDYDRKAKTLRVTRAQWHRCVSSAVTASPSRVMRRSPALVSSTWPATRPR